MRLREYDGIDDARFAPGIRIMEDAHLQRPLYMCTVENEAGILGDINGDGFSMWNAGVEFACCFVSMCMDQPSHPMQQQLPAILPPPPHAPTPPPPRALSPMDIDDALFGSASPLSSS